MEIKDDSESQPAVQVLIPQMLACIAGVLNAGEETVAQDVLELFIEVAEMHPRFLRRQLSPVVAAMLQVGGSE